MRDSPNYDRYEMFVDFEEILGNLDLIQIEEFVTWSRIVNNILKESVLDRVCTVYFLMDAFASEKLDNKFPFSKKTKLVSYNLV